jgi:hypothetical protein
MDQIRLLSEEKYSDELAALAAQEVYDQNLWNSERISLRPIAHSSS